MKPTVTRPNTAGTPAANSSLLHVPEPTQFHGSASDYLRNTVFDANDWFNNYYAQPRQPLHQNDFSGSFGGPFWIPRIYDGRKRTFFFANYEGLRANIPIAAYQQYTPDAALVASSTGVIHTFLASLP